LAAALHEAAVAQLELESAQLAALAPTMWGQLTVHGLVPSLKRTPVVGLLLLPYTLFQTMTAGKTEVEEEGKWAVHSL
jgi:hypothetical protein